MINVVSRRINPLTVNCSWKALLEITHRRASRLLENLLTLPGEREARFVALGVINYARAVRFACSAVSAAPCSPHPPLFVFAGEFCFFCTPVECLKYLRPSGQLCHILGTAVTHFLFPFQINSLTSFTAFVHKNHRLSFQATIP